MSFLRLIWDTSWEWYPAHCFYGDWYDCIYFGSKDGRYTHTCIIASNVVAQYCMGRGLYNAASPHFRLWVIHWAICSHLRLNQNLSVFLTNGKNRLVVCVCVCLCFESLEEAISLLGSLCLGLVNPTGPKPRQTHMKHSNMLDQENKNLYRST